MLVSFVALALLSSAQLARVNGIPLLLYTDHICLTPSASNPNVTLGLNVCAVTTGLESFILDPTPCTTGNVMGWIFLDTACRNPGNLYPSGNNKYCYAPLEGGGIASLMLTCGQSETTPLTPESTTTIVVGPVANPITSNSSSSSSTSTDGTPDPSAPNDWWDSLSQGTRIGFIVALAVGVPLFVVLAIIGRNRQPGIANSGPFNGCSSAGHPVYAPVVGVLEGILEAYHGLSNQRDCESLDSSSARCETSKSISGGNSSMTEHIREDQ